VGVPPITEFLALVRYFVLAPRNILPVPYYVIENRIIGNAFPITAPVGTANGGECAEAVGIPVETIRIVWGWVLAIVLGARVRGIVDIAAPAGYRVFRISQGVAVCFVITGIKKEICEIWIERRNLAL